MDFETLLQQMEAQRPDLSESLTLLRQYHSSGKKNGDAEDVEVQTEPDRIRELETFLEKQKTINKNLIRQYDRLKDNYEMLLGHLDEMANATGACPECWGEDSSCHYCRGRGKPGYYLPDQQHFDTYIKPVLQKIKENKPTH